jgi:hypothetical protein
VTACLLRGGATPDAAEYVGREQIAFASWEDILAAGVLIQLSEAPTSGEQQRFPLDAVVRLAGYVRRPVGGGGGSLTSRGGGTG